MVGPAAHPPARPRWALEHSLTLLHTFIVATALILGAAAFLLTSFLTSTLKTQAIDDARSELARYVDGVVRPELVKGNGIRVRPRVSARLLGGLQSDPDLVTVKVWRSDGVLAWTNRGVDRIGRRYALTAHLGVALKTKHAIADIDQLRGEENVLERKLGFHHLLEVYAPITSADGRRAIGSYEIYANPVTVERLIASRKHLVWLVVTAVFLAVYAALVLLVRGASRTLRRQTETLRTRAAKLVESYRMLEENSLEAIASLNATVDAKDPYTAGHSLRVQRIALAIAEELGVPRRRLEAVRFAGLFHDIGKIAVPDAILTKPARLTDEEWEVIKRHPATGAEIVGRLGRLRDAVPLILYHHERWDGAGYPFGLAADDIPSEACVIGLADAWDAMTSDRPYHRARSLEDAAEEIRRGRATQFSPHVVDAFFAALRRRPGVFTPDSDSAEAVVFG